MSTFETGRKAEELAAAWLENKGFRVLDRNWRNRWCEIDIVAKKGRIIHIVEVKYRRTATSGDGFEAITPNKANRLMRAALMWLNQNRAWQADYQIDVMSISGFPEPKDVEYMPNAVAAN